MPSKHALLVGIDHYLSGSRPDKNGKPIALKNLNGCVNDVTIMNELLQQFGFPLPVLLVSPYRQSTATPTASLDGTHCQPMYSNIKRELDRILAQAKAGDTFFFHYSGHGVRLDPISGSPHQGSTDRSILPMDFGCSQPAIRGWQLHAMFSELCSNKVHVVVSLDSCFSAGAWRDDGIPRSPEGWEPPPNLPNDDTVEDVPSRISPSSRDGNLEESWDINSELFTLMAACQKSYPALEKTHGQKIYGAFTYTLYQYLKIQNRGRLPTYRTIRDHIEFHISPQVPKIFGRDKLVFLETHETFLAAPVQVTIAGSRATLPIGKIHCVKEGAEFISRKSFSHLTIKIDKVCDHESEGSLDGNVAPDLLEFVPLRWYSEKTMEVFVESTLGKEFRTDILARLEERIASTIVVQEYNGVAEDVGVQTIRFCLQRTEANGIDITCPGLLGYPGPVHGLHTSDANSSAAPIESAMALAHLFRLVQIYSIHEETTDDDPRFSMTIDRSSCPTAPLFVGEKVTFAFKNEDNSDLYFTVLDLGPGLHVLQKYPVRDVAQKVRPGEKREFTMVLSLPNKLHHPSVNYKNYPYRDIFRTVVTKGQRVSLKSLELPDIWDAALMQCGKQGGSGRDGDVCSEVNWWVKDIQVYTRREDM